MAKPRCTFQCGPLAECPCWLSFVCMCGTSSVHSVLGAAVRNVSRVDVLPVLLLSVAAPLSLSLLSSCLPEYPHPNKRTACNSLSLKGEHALSQPFTLISCWSRDGRQETHPLHIYAAVPCPLPLVLACAVGLVLGIVFGVLTRLFLRFMRYVGVLAVG